MLFSSPCDSGFGGHHWSWQVQQKLPVCKKETTDSLHDKMPDHTGGLLEGLEPYGYYSHHPVDFVEQSLGDDDHNVNMQRRIIPNPVYPTKCHEGWVEGDGSCYGMPGNKRKKKQYHHEA